MKLNLLLLMSSLPVAIFAQDNVATDTVSVENKYPNTFSSWSSNVEKFDSKAKKLNDWSISVGVGAPFIIQADLNSFYKGTVNWGWNAYVSLDKQISHTFGLSLQYQMGKTNQKGQLPGKAGELAGVADANTKYRQVSLLGDVNFSNLLRRVDNKSPYRWALHGYAGIGFQGYDMFLLDNYGRSWEELPVQHTQKLGIASFFYQGGVGLKYKLSRRLDIEGRVMYIITGDEEFDSGGETRDAGSAQIGYYNTINDTYSDNMLTVNLGLSVKLGKHLTHLAWYDPLQNIYARAKAIQDLNPEFVVCDAGDNDDDGVCDDWDRQLDTPRGARVDGAGVALDMDLDGVIDLYDQCVTVPGPVENNGCPEVVEAPVLPSAPTSVTEIERVNKEFQGIEFALNKAVIRPKSFGRLDRAAEIIKTLDTNSQFLVIGCTDTRGSEAYNQKLSQRRVESVVKYLTNKGVPKGMLIAEGRGENDLKYPECEPATKCPEWKNEANRRVYFEAKK